MTTQLNDVHERGREAVAILWASEPVIYGRFGYGLAQQRLCDEGAPQRARPAGRLPQ
jgi:predicted acetyltransferase